MGESLFKLLSEAFGSRETEIARGLLERAAKQAADVLALGDRERLAAFAGALGVVHADTATLEPTPELHELRGCLAALIELTRATLDRAEDLDAVRKVGLVDRRPALLAAIKAAGAARIEALAATLGVEAPAIQRPIQDLLTARILSATRLDDGTCYALTPLGFVVARRLEERAAATPSEPAATPKAPSLDREPQPSMPAELSTPTDGLPAVEAAAEPPPATEEWDTDEMELALEDLAESTEDAVVTEEILPGEAPVPTPSPREEQDRRARSKVRVAVLYGGMSAEREVSLRAGEAVGAALRESGYQVEMIDVREAALSELSPRRVDVAFIALRGTFGEDGGIQAVLDALGVPYTGSGVDASRLASDKIAAKRTLRLTGVPTPAYVEVDAEWAEPLKLRAARSLGFPVVLKPSSEGSSLGMVVAETDAALPAVLDEPFKFDTRALAEKYVGGRELTVGILDGRPLPIIELVYDGPALTSGLRRTPGAVRSVVQPDLPADVTARVLTAALAAHECLGCRGCSRVDLRLNAEGRPEVLEINAVPPLTPDGLLAQAAAAAGIPFAALCQQLVDLARPTAAATT